MSSCSHAGVHMISMTRAAVSVMRVQLMFVDVMVQCGSQVVIYPCQPAHARMRSCNATRSAIRKCARTRTRDCMNRCDERVHSGCMNVVPVSSSVCEPFSSTYASQQKKNVNAGGVATSLISVGRRAVNAEDRRVTARRASTHGTAYLGELTAAAAIVSSRPSLVEWKGNRVD
jgi:hypothetical protein